MKYTLWIDYGLEGWAPYDFDSIAGCLDRLGHFSTEGYRITRNVTLGEQDGVRELIFRALFRAGVDVADIRGIAEGVIADRGIDR